MKANNHRNECRKIRKDIHQTLGSKNGFIIAKFRFRFMRFENLRLLERGFRRFLGRRMRRLRACRRRFQWFFHWRELCFWVDRKSNFSSAMTFFFLSLSAKGKQIGDKKQKTKTNLLRWVFVASPIAFCHVS